MYRYAERQAALVGRQRVEDCKMQTIIHLSVVATIFASFSIAKGEETCRTYAGGQVYPDERKLGVEHALHWSKAQSKLRFFLEWFLMFKEFLGASWGEYQKVNVFGEASV